MRNPNRIDEFLVKLGEIWKKNCPDWRFGQLMDNVLNSSDSDPFFLEEPEFLTMMEEFFSESK